MPSSRLTEQEKADLVAYLDGELDPDASQALEAKLARDPAARAEVDLLKRTWEMLDFLPRPEPSESFTHRTMEKLAPAATSAAARARMPVPPRWALGVGWAAALLLALGGGYGGLTLLFHAQKTPPEPTEKDLVRDLRVIENKRLYEVADDMEFLKNLDHPDLFGEDPHGS